MATADQFHDGAPRVTAIKAVKNQVLAEQHERFRSYLTERHRQEPKARELYHGSNNNILTEPEFAASIGHEGTTKTANFAPREA